MALSTWGVNAPEAVKRWSAKLFQEALAETHAKKFMGTSSNALLQRHTDLQKAPGDRIRVTLRMLLDGAGVLGDGTLEGNEEALTTYTDDLLIDQLRNAVRSGGKMSEQRVPFNVRQEAMSALRDWLADRIDTGFFNQLAGNTAQTDVRYTGLQAAVAPDANHIIRAGSQSDDQSITSSDTFTLDLIDEAVENAKLVEPLIRPVRVGGEDMYVLFLHPSQERSLRTNTSTGQWMDIQKAAMMGGEIASNPIFTGALGIYNGVVLHCNRRIPKGVNSSTGVAVDNTRRAVFCGAQAAIIGFGEKSASAEADWYEESFDYGNQLGVSAGLVMGLKKTRFNSADFGTTVITTYSAN